MSGKRSWSCRRTRCRLNITRGRSTTVITVITEPGLETCELTILVASPATILIAFRLDDVSRVFMSTSQIREPIHGSIVTRVTRSIKDNPCRFWCGRNFSWHASWIWCRSTRRSWVHSWKRSIGRIWCRLRLGTNIFFFNEITVKAATTGRTFTIPMQAYLCLIDSAAGGCFSAKLEVETTAQIIRLTLVECCFGYGQFVETVIVGHRDGISKFLRPDVNAFF
mmetsp:Transcript_29674/g.43865  ORF Transcript_29674/g.43865 Transcript_29674/m.43865 type:complete len:223 (-) Transcript_29674:1527-2195(-)